jgi:2,3,4,5-tetrahydropyridine-2-carboxylate N-succinyltransferase
MTETRVDLRSAIEGAFDDPTAVNAPDVRSAVEDTIRLLDRGELRMAEKIEGEWKINAWLQKAILMFFRVRQMETIEVGPFEYHDKLPLKRDYAMRGVRAVPPATARYGSYVERGVVLMPSYVNIGAWVGSGTMVDTWATVGSGAQIGRDVHLAGGVGIGGVLEPPGARPVIVEDGAFIGSRSIVVEGVLVEEGAVLGANVSLSSTTHVIDVTQNPPVTHQGRVPARSVVVPGTRPKTFPGGEFQISCALIIGQRSASTDQKTALNAVVREFGISL